MFKKVPIVISGVKEATSASTFTAKTLPCKPGDVLCVDMVSVCDNDSDTKIVHVGVVRNELALYFETIALTTKTYFYNTKPKIYIPSGYRFILKFVTPTSGDKYYYTIYAHLEVETESE